MHQGRPRRRARDIARLPKRGNMWFMVVLVLVGLALVLGLKWTMGDSSSAAFESIVGDPELDLPLGPTDTDGGLEDQRDLPTQNFGKSDPAPQDAETPDVSGTSSETD